MKPLKKPLVWVGDCVCDFCKADCADTKFVDGGTIHGPWAIMCIPCFRGNGIGVAHGRGQLYLKKICIDGGAE